MIDVYYTSSTSGMVKEFAEKLGWPAHDLGERDVRQSIPHGPWVLITPSYKTGNANNDTIPEPVKRFLYDPETRRKLVGIMGSGNRNFGSYYQAAARHIARVSGRPILYEFELQGTPWEVQEAKTIMNELELALAQRHSNPSSD